MFYIKNKTAYWSRKIPYVIRNYPDSDLIKAAISYIEDVTGNLIEFEDVTNNTKNIQSYIVFIKSEQNYSDVGKRRGENFIELRVDNIRPKRTIVHEIFHKLGGAHEHQAPQRDNYIRVNEDNIRIKHGQFGIKSSGFIFEEPYDFESISHYDAFAFSKDSTLKTIEIKNQHHFHFYDVMGLKDTFSDGDIKSLKKIYSKNR